MEEAGRAWALSQSTSEFPSLWQSKRWLPWPGELRHILSTSTNPGKGCEACTSSASPAGDQGQQSQALVGDTLQALGERGQLPLNQPLLSLAHCLSGIVTRSDLLVDLINMYSLRRHASFH